MNSKKDKLRRVYNILTIEVEGNCDNNTYSSLIIEFKDTFRTYDRQTSFFKFMQSLLSPSMTAGINVLPGWLLILVIER